MAKYGMVIDISRCTGCYCCFAACKDEFWDNEYSPYTAAQPKHGQFWMNVAKNERGKFPYVKVAHMPVPCMQCENAPCIKIARNNAVYKRADGIVVIDPAKSAGQRQLLEEKACPYGAIFWNEDKQLPQKCTFCVHRIEAGKVPRCVQACPSECIKFGDLDDPKSEVSILLKSRVVEQFIPEKKTNPRVYYIDLYKMTRLFVAGAVVLRDLDDCALGATVYLQGLAGISAHTSTNAFGNFEFDGLEPSQYSLKIEFEGYIPKTLDIDLSSSEYLGDILLDNVNPKK
jgi:Fe-S-cluster-containing dehydrogenase component